MDDIKQCPYCAETIKKAAIVCKHCGRELPGYKEAAPSGAPKRKPDAELSGEKETVERKSHVKWWLAGLGIVSAFAAHPYGGPELWGNVGVSAVLWFAIGWVIDAIRENRWKKNSQSGRQDRQGAKNENPTLLKTYLKVGLLVVIVGIIVFLIYLIIVTPQGGRSLLSSIFGEPTRTRAPTLDYSAMLGGTTDPNAEYEETLESANATVVAVLPICPVTLTVFS